jgi:Skp family chaperone for outer membrane proteins
LHFAAVAALERLSQSHPKAHHAAEPLRQAKEGFEEGYKSLTAALDERDAIVNCERAAFVLKRTQADAATLAQESERTRSRYQRMQLELARSRNLFLRGWPPPCELDGLWDYSRVSGSSIFLSKT